MRYDRVISQDVYALIALNKTILLLLHWINSVHTYISELSSLTRILRVTHERAVTHEAYVPVMQGIQNKIIYFGI